MVAAPAHAADPIQTYVTGEGTYSLVGRVPGVPGTSHTGFVYVDEGDIVSLMYDWRCPKGVTAPAGYDQGSPATSCTVVRAREFYYAPTQTEHGPLNVTLTGPLMLMDEQTQLQVKAVAAFDVAFRQTGPITTTVETGGTNRVVHQTAPMSFTGRLDWLRLSDPRVHAQVIYDERNSSYSKS